MSARAERGWPACEREAQRRAPEPNGGEHVSALAVRVAPLTLGHGAVDFVQGAVPALLPYLVDRFGLSYTAAGGFLVALTAASSVTQPLFGYLSRNFCSVESASFFLPVLLCAYASQ